MRPSKCLVTISRHWDHPTIHSTVNEVEIALSLSLEDYLVALAEEMASADRWYIQTNTQLKALVKQASERVVSKVKEESAKVV